MARASSSEILGSFRKSAFSLSESRRTPSPRTPDSAIRYSHSTTRRFRISAYSLKYGASASLAPRYRPSMELTAVSASRGILTEIPFDTREDGLFALLEARPRELFIHANIPTGELFHKLLRRLGQHGVFVRVAVLLEPQPQEFLVETLGLFACGHALLIPFYLPVARRIGGVNFVYQIELSGIACPERCRGVGTEFVLGIHQNEPLIRRDFLP